MGNTYIENKDKIIDALKRAGLEPEAVSGVASRISRLNRKETWKELFRQ